MKLLTKIQQELKAPKSQYNSFGKYKYRNLEDILTAVKPLLGTARLLITDEIVQVGDRIYVKATVKLTEENESVEATAYAREALTQKGMNDAQITGSTSSYARKYAISGLFLIDDNKDPDTQDNRTDLPAIKKQLAGLKTHAEAQAFYKKHVGKGYDDLLVARGKELTGK